MKAAPCLGACTLLLSVLAGVSHAADADPVAGAPAYLLEWGAAGQAEGQFDAPRGLAVAADGQVYVTDTLNHRIQVFTASGEFLRALGSPGSGPGQFILPLDVALDARGNVFVADAGNFRVQKLSSSGRPLNVWGSGGYGDGQFGLPSSICVTGDGRVFVADGATHTLQEFTPQGKFVARHGTHGLETPGALRGPRGLAADPDGSVWILDTINLRVQRLARDGSFTWWPLSGYRSEPAFYPTDLALGPDGSVYVADARTFAVERFSPDGESRGRWGGFGNGPGQFTKPTGIAIDARGDVYVAESHAHRVQKFAGR